MAEVKKWFDRRFDGPYPAELVPNVCARLRGTPARLEEMLRGRGAEALTAKMLTEEREQWSAQEHAGHLLDLEPLWLKRVDDYAAGAEVLTPTDLSNRKTHEANHNSRAVAEILRDFREARERLLARVGELETSSFTRAVLHPRLKTPMRLPDHLYFVAEHDDHHLARIWELLEGRAEERG